MRLALHRLLEARDHGAAHLPGRRRAPTLELAVEIERAQRAAIRLLLVLDLVRGALLQLLRVLPDSRHPILSLRVIRVDVCVVFDDHHYSVLQRATIHIGLRASCSRCLLAVDGARGAFVKMWEPLLLLLVLLQGRCQNSATDATVVVLVWEVLLECQVWSYVISSDHRGVFI